MKPTFRVHESLLVEHVLEMTDGFAIPLCITDDIKVYVLSVSVQKIRHEIQKHSTNKNRIDVATSILKLIEGQLKVRIEISDTYSRFLTSLVKTFAHGTPDEVKRFGWSIPFLTLYLCSSMRIRVFLLRVIKL